MTQNVQLSPIADTPLFADFDTERELVSVGLPIRFNDLSKGLRIVSWEWQFEGGTPATSTERNPIVIYETPGLFDVKLTVIDANGQTHTITKNELIDVYHAIPIHNGDMTLTDCRGLFLPSGGDCGHYKGNENYKLTLRPENSDQKISINFLKFKTQPNADVLSVYDGASINCPLIGSFSGSELPDSIIATNPLGALTFTFSSDMYINFFGWVATVTCIGGEAINEKDSTTAKIYPNPCKNSFTIDSNRRANYALYDALGQCVISGKTEGKTQIEASGLTQGIYLLHLWNESGSHVEKLVIEK